jgi:hypothetical protein
MYFFIDVLHFYKNNNIFANQIIFYEIKNPTFSIFP